MSTEPHDASAITGSMDVIGGSASGAGGIDYQVKFLISHDLVCLTVYIPRNSVPWLLGREQELEWE